METLKAGIEQAVHQSIKPLRRHANYLVRLAPAEFTNNHKRHNGKNAIKLFKYRGRS